MKIINIDNYRQKRMGDTSLGKEESLINFIKIVSYYANNTTVKLYKTKLHKMLFYTQFLYYKKNKKRLINATFIKNHYGPVMEEIDDFLQQSVELGIIELISTQYGTYIRPKVRFHEKDYNNELATIKEVGTKFCSYTSKDISEYSHNESLWINTSVKDEIKIERAYELNEF